MTKVLHLSDIHIGKRINGFPMTEDQEHILNEIVRIATIEKPQAIILAGDIYDKAVPAAEAVTMFDDFLVKLSKLGCQVFIISGNHDSAERLAYASRLIDACGIHLSPVYNGRIEPIALDDNVTVHMLPFIKPAIVQHYAGEDAPQLDSYDAAMRYVIDHMDIDPNRKNILVTHQFITNAERSESEDAVIGGLDNIDVSAFDKFDYVALGHLHRPQSCGRETVRYSGSPMKYSFSEVDDRKSVTVIEIDNDITLRTIPLKPLREWYDLRGTYDELTAKSFYEGTDYQESWVRITLTDEEDIPDGARKLQTIYHRLMELRYDNKRTRGGMTAIEKPVDVDGRKPADLFAELFDKQNCQEMTDQQSKYLNSLIEKIW